MAIRMFAGLICMSMLAVPNSLLRAQVTPVSIDGCASLARVIYTEVAAAVAYGPGRSGPWRIELGQGDILVCTHVARTVSRAFTSAIKATGIKVKWHREFDDSGDYCRGSFLSHCSPLRLSSSNRPSEFDDVFVQQSWQLVSRAVMNEMYNASSSDEVRFRDSDLKLRLGLSLRSVGDSDRL